MAVTCIKAVMEKIAEIDLCTGGRLSVEVQIVNMDRSIRVGLSNVKRDDFFQVEVLARFLTCLEHDTHRLGAVYVCVLPPPVSAVHYSVYTSQGGKEIVFQTAILSMLFSIKDVGLSDRWGRSAQVVLDLILDLFHADRLVIVQIADEAVI